MTLLVDLLKAALVFAGVLGVATGVQRGWRWWVRRGSGASAAGNGRRRQ